MICKPCGTPVLQITALISYADMYQCMVCNMVYEKGDAELEEE